MISIKTFAIILIAQAVMFAIIGAYREKKLKRTRMVDISKLPKEEQEKILDEFRQMIIDSRDDI